MFDSKQLDELTRRVSAVIPPGVRTLHDDLEKNIRAAISAAAERLELVSRNEFEAQSAVLARSRAKIEALEARITRLEAELRLADKG